MKPPVVLLVSNDPAVASAVRSSQAAFRQLQAAVSDFDLAIIDLDPGVHGSALLEAIGDRLPTLAVTSLEENYMDPITRRHGAFACLAKPFTADRLAELVNRALREGVTAA